MYVMNLIIIINTHVTVHYNCNLPFLYNYAQSNQIVMYLSLYKLNLMNNQRKLFILFIVSLNFSVVKAQDLSTLAGNFLSSLNDNQKKKAQYTFDNEERFNWHYVPKSRNGLPLKELTAKQREAALSLLKASLSEQGYKKATSIMELENVLRQVEGRASGDTYRDHLNYYITIFGTPSKDKPWGWRLEGHHVSLNFSSVKGMVESSTPSFFGSNPATVPSGESKGEQVLKQEMALGFSLVNSLSDAQLKTALLSEAAPGEIITRNDRQVDAPDPEGISVSALTEEQKKIFMQLLDVYVKNYAFGFSSKLMDKIQKAGIENLRFAWAGSRQPGAGHYYRIQGPMLLIEYDNTQNNANHIHSVVRDLTNDFAGDILREHYAREHAK